ncbi:MAG: hypothetical protein IKW64_04740 [Clostridia bacterium]|nr:hypothetical protein [Clostridia bacterium]
MFCKNCDKIVGSINKHGYRRLSISLICTCGCYGNVEIVADGSLSDFTEKIDKAPDFKDSVVHCKECQTPIFGILENRVENYSFFAECVCGAKYDTKPQIHKRLGETAKLLKQNKKHL